MSESDIYFVRFYQKGETSQADCDFNPGNALAMEGKEKCRLLQQPWG